MTNPLMASTGLESLLKVLPPAQSGQRDNKLQQLVQMLTAGAQVPAQISPARYF